MKNKLLWGVGINDADYKLTAYENIIDINLKQARKLVWICPFYSRWRGMIGRCYSSKFAENNPSYIGCTVCEEWLTFSTFKAWMEKQDWEGKHLDKDILVRGNKIYSPETCIFVTQSVNNFFLSENAANREFPTGVTWHSRDKVFHARCGNPFTGKTENLGIFDCPLKAHEAWKRRKSELAIKLSMEQEDMVLAQAILRHCENYF